MTIPLFDLAKKLGISMKITRIFRVRVVPELRQEFEEKFSTISVNAVCEASGSLGASIYKPTNWAPYEYAMISQWKNEAALKAFAGKKWSEAVIPSGMEEFIVESWVHHYESW